MNILPRDKEPNFKPIPTHVHVNGKPFSIAVSIEMAMFVAKRYIREHKAEHPLVLLIPQAVPETK